MLDVDHGTYPFVTSVQPGRRRGVHRRRHRADPDRPGDRRDQGLHDPGRRPGPFPTELFDADGERLWKVGGEVGVSTGRDRALRVVRRRDRPLRDAASTG